MSSLVFDLKHFSLRQTYTAQRVGTDALLLGAWPWKHSLPDRPRLLDVGTGTGVIALMLAQRFDRAEVEGWELEAGAVKDARYNVEQSPFADRVQIHACDYEAGYKACDKPFDLVISNPPYYIEKTLPQDARLTLARHTEGGLSPELLLRTAHELLAPEGGLAMITPVESLPFLRQVAVEHGWYLAEVVTIYSLPGRPKRSLQLWRRLSSLRSYTLTHTTSLVLQDKPDHPSSDYRAWVKDFLLSF